MPLRAANVAPTTADETGHHPEFLGSPRPARRRHRGVPKPQPDYQLIRMSKMIVRTTVARESREVTVSALGAIPVLDIGDGGPLQAARLANDRMHCLFRHARRTFTSPALALMDGVSRRWLDRSNNPYRGEIDEIAALLGKPGAYALNTSYEWACKSGVGTDPEGGVRLIARSRLAIGRARPQPDRRVAARAGRRVSQSDVARLCRCDYRRGTRPFRCRDQSAAYDALGCDPTDRLVDWARPTVAVACLAAVAPAASSVRKLHDIQRRQAVLGRDAALPSGVFHSCRHDGWRGLRYRAHC